MADDLSTPEEKKKESFERRSAVTVAILASVCAFASLCTSNTCSDVLLGATNASDSWAYFQSKSMKSHTYEVERDIAEMLLPTAVDEAKRKAVVDACTKQSARYAKEKEEAKAQAEGYQKTVVDSARKNGDYEIASLLMQVAIVIVSISILVRRNALWAGGTLIGLAGTAIMVLTMLGVRLSFAIPY